ncbi:single-strand DNA endonuclease 1 [Aristolochia californica]|uniref:single-strand DNA endonuclease 1 n=1 Tax=Aristolochia californica TaxID=171875 RepID=UPI0035E328BD
MGVKNLWDILESCKKTLPLHHLQNKRVCVDLSCWIVQLQNTCKNSSFSKEKIYLRNLFHRLRALIALNCSVVLVADGSIPAIKLSTYRKRLGSGSEVIRDENNIQRASSLPRNMGSDFSCMIKEVKVLGMALGIPCLDGLEEAEAQCALLNLETLCDGCFTSDSDVFLFGARTVYRDIYLGEGGYVVCYEMADIERKLGFGRNSLISLALLLGSDYSQGVRGLGRETACRIIKTIGDDVVLHRLVSEGVGFAKKVKMMKEQADIFKCNGGKLSGSDHKEGINDVSVSPSEPFLQVANAYLKPKCHLPDSEAVLSLFIPHTFQRTQLQELCAEFFGWSPQKTDDYILPKIAERNLRCFAKLRCASSELGAQFPLDKMPVACPVSAIVKSRKLQGKEYFEVSWDRMDGLQTSIVPADLVRSACSEKISEFMAKKAENNKDKRKPRPRKAANKAAVHEINLRLQGLLLSIESQGQEPQSDVDHQSRLDTQVIDLSTPSPSSRCCKILKCQEPNAKQVDVIDLSESESEVSPVHTRKARELRLFLASIKDDIF